MAAVSSIIAGASLALGFGGKLLEARSAKKQRKREAQAQAQKELEARNVAGLDAANAQIADPAQFSLGAPGASDSLFRTTRRKAASTTGTATGKPIGGLS